MRVTVHYAYQPLTPLASPLFGNSVSVLASTTMAIE
jgi:hypothetical protein